MAYNDRSSLLAFLATERIEFHQNPSGITENAPAPGPSAPIPAEQQPYYAAPAPGPSAPIPAEQQPYYAAPAPGPSAPIPAEQQPYYMAPTPEPVEQPGISIRFDTNAQAQPNPSTGKRQEPASHEKRTNFVVIGGIAVFGVIVIGLLAAIFFKQNKSPALSENMSAGSSHYTAYIPSPAEASESAFIPSEEPTGTAAPTSEQPQELTAQQQAMANEIVSRLSQHMPEQSAQVSTDVLFQAALNNVKIEKIVFSESTIAVALLFPDPKKLKTLDIEPYEPHSGAQDYIKQKYAELISRVGSISDTVRYEFDIPYQTQSNGDETFDITLPFLFFPLYDYSEAFIPHMEQYMTDLGFYTAAGEILMPDFQDWESHKGADNGEVVLHAYFSSLAGVLSDKGINYYGNITVDTDTIQSLLETRFRETWLFENLKYENNSSGLYISVYFPNDFCYFYPVYETLDAQYRAGKITAPVSLPAADALFVSEVRKHANAFLADPPQSRKDTMLRGDYSFDWETLGEKGIAACPQLVEQIRQFINGYDFHFTSLTMSFGLK